MAKAIQAVTDGGAVAPVAADENAALISMIERAARDPNVDIDKMERLFQMRERMDEKRAAAEFWAAFAVMQPELPTVERNGAIKMNDKDEKGQKTGKQKDQSKYALWEDIDEAARPVYSKHGFSLSFRISQIPERLTVTAVLAHRNGHREETSFSSPIDATGSKNNVQGWGSAMSYAKRYAGTAILNIVTRGQDDDGKAAGAPAPVSDEQAIQLRDWLEATNTEPEQFLAYFKAESIASFPAAKFDAAVAAFKKKAGKS